MTIRLKILLGCLALTSLTVALGDVTRTAQRNLGAVATSLYDDTFLAMSYLRDAQSRLMRAEAELRRPSGEASDAQIALVAAIQEVAENVQVASMRAVSPEAQKMGHRLVESLNNVSTAAQAAASPAASLLEAITTAKHDFEVAVEVYAADGFRRRSEAGRLVEATVQQAWWAMGLSVLVALLITLLLTRSIVPPLTHALKLADAIAAGRLDNSITVRGRGEPAQLLRALSAMQSSIAAAMLRIHTLMQAQASHHASEIAVQNARLEAALSNMVQGLCLLDPQGRLVVANRRFAELFGEPEPNLSLAQIFAGPDLAPLQGSAGTKAQSGEFIAKLPDGRFIAVAQRVVEAGGWVTTYEDVTVREQAESRLAHMARHDALTGLPNRAAFHDRMTRALMRLRRGGSGLAVLCLDLDRFKTVNDNLGHQAGDALLRAVAARLLECVRDTDMVVRLGGDEFAVILDGAAQPAEVAVVAERIIVSLTSPYNLDGHHVSIGASVGIAIASTTATDADTLVRCADLALYRAKADGRGTFRFFEPEMDEQMRIRRELELDLSMALHRGELTIFYQPQVDTEREAVGGFEALLRWNHPVRGSVSPMVFIPLAEDTGMISSIGAWVIAQACAEAASWPASVKVAVNLSAFQFRDRSLPQLVAKTLAESGLQPSRLELEITESLLLRDDEMVLEILHALRALGVRIAMDDFGTGYSSLSYLRRFPFDKIKIDQSFVRGMMEEEDCAAIVRSVVSLGRSLGMSVNAEGVETLAQFQALRDQGCAELQGYLFSRPRPADDVRSMLDCFQNAVPAAHMGSSNRTSFLHSPSTIASVPLKDSCGFGKEHEVVGEHTQDKFSAAESDILPQSALS